MFLKVGAALLLLAADAGGGQDVDLQLRLERVGELGWRAVMRNAGRGERVFLLHEGLQPCELVLEAVGKGPVDRLDWRTVMTMDGTASAKFFKSVPAGGEVVMAEGTLVKKEGGYGMRWGTFEFRDLAPGRYTATVRFQSVAWHRVDRPKNIWLGTVSSQPVSFALR